MTERPITRGRPQRPITERPITERPITERPITRPLVIGRDLCAVGTPTMFPLEPLNSKAIGQTLVQDT